MSSTRRIVMFNQVTADGYFAATDGSLDWIVPEPEIQKAAVKSMPETDLILLGRRTYELFVRFWPHALDDSPTTPDPHDRGRRSSEVHAMAVWLNDTPKLVFSRTLKSLTWKNSRLVPELHPGEIEALKQQSGKDMIIFGSGSIVSLLTQHRLIDEYQFAVSPIILGSGRSLLQGVSTSLNLDLREARPYQTGNVMLRYVRHN